MLKPESSLQTSAWAHAVCYATLRRNAVTNADFAIPGLHMLRLREAGAPSDPAQMITGSPRSRPDLAAFAVRQRADYLWYFGNVEPARLPAGAVVVHRTPGSLLIRLARSD